jgi:translation initiation factor 1
MNPENINDLSQLRSIFGLPEQVEPLDENNKINHISADFKDQVRVHLVRLKGNKEATHIKGISPESNDIESLGQWLKKKCGAGGSVKNDEIIIQGNQRTLVIQLLKEKGYKNTKAAGG